MTLHVITGGPGSGKTSLIEALASAGYATAPESGRSIIQDQVAKGGDALPWDNREAFAKAMEVADRRTHALMQGKADRILLSNLPVDPALQADCRTCVRYASPIFIAPPWPDIYTTDGERRQDFAEAARTYAVMHDTYTALGYALVELPRLPLTERVALVLARSM